MKSKIFGIIIALALAIGCMPAASAAHFTDILDNHWAAEYINTMADGGLINGYGNGKFGPADQFRVDHLAKIICAAKGYEFEEKNGFWAYGAIEYCLNELKCMPNMGAITAANYSVPCSRELAFYMLVTGLGTQNATATVNVTKADIPDFDTISPQYRDAVLTAYKYGLTIGYGTDGSFNPKGLLNRAQAAAIMVRAGYTTAAEKKPVAPGEILTNEELFKAIKNMDGVTWKESNYQYPELRATDPKYGGVSVMLRPNYIMVTAHERNTGAWFKGNTMVDVYGNPITSQYDANGKFLVSSGYSYTARRLMHDILALAYPTEGEAAYGAVKDVFLQKVYEVGGLQTYPSALRWHDERYLDVTFNGASSSISMAIGNLDNSKQLYNVMKNEKPAARNSPYSFSQADATAAYELNKW